MKAISLLLIVFICMVGLAATKYGGDPEKMWNITDTTLNSAFNNATASFQIANNTDSLGQIIVNIVFKIVDATLYVTHQVVRIGARVAIDNPQINFKLIIDLLIIALIFYILIPVLKLAVVLYILVKDIIASYKEKKRIRELRRK